MKNLFAIVLLLIATVACKEDEKIIDPVFEFVSIKGNETAVLNENTHSVKGYPIMVQLWAAKPYSTDIDITVDMIGTNAVAGTDFAVPSAPLKIRAGSLLSDTLWITTINNAVNSELPRSLEVKIKSVSQPDIKIGFGIQNPSRFSVLFTIVDDECSAKTTIFNSSLNNAVNWGDGDILFPATGVLAGDELTVTGNLIDYGGLQNASIKITLTPASAGATRGTAMFGEQVAGTDSDGYDYKFTQTGTGSYDVCAGTVSIAYDIYWLNGATWTFWYSVTNLFSLIQCTETIAIFNANLDNTLDWGDGDILKPATGTVSGSDLTVTGDLIDYSAFSEATLKIKLTPYTAGGTKGSASFGEQETGTDSDGYDYKFTQVGDGSYDVCSGNVEIEYDIYYLSGSAWTYWYSVKNVFTIR